MPVSTAHRVRTLAAYLLYIFCAFVLLLSLCLSTAAFAETDHECTNIVSETFLSAPAPDPTCYGRVSIDSASQILDVIQRARDSGLLRADEVVAFDPNANFYRGLYARDIEYYLDDSILAILWKEEIDGKSCSFVEVKIAEASQFRRKLADDRYGSNFEYFATALAAESNAVVATNADYYRHRDFGMLVYDRELFRFNTDYYAEGSSISISAPARSTVDGMTSSAL